MWVVLNYYPSTSARSVYYVAKAMRTHPTFYVGRLRPYHHHEVSSSGEYNRHVQGPPRDYFGPEPASQSGSVERHSGGECQPLRRERLDAPARYPIGRKRTPIGRPIDEGGCVAPTPPIETLLPLLFGAITQIVHALMETTTSACNSNKRFGVDIHAPTTAIGGFARWLTLSRGAYLEPP